MNHPYRERAACSAETLREILENQPVESLLNMAINLLDKCEYYHRGEYECPFSQASRLVPNDCWEDGPLVEDMTDDSFFCSPSRNRGIAHDPRCPLMLFKDLLEMFDRSRA